MNEQTTILIIYLIGAVLIAIPLIVDSFRSRKLGVVLVALIAILLWPLIIPGVIYLLLIYKFTRILKK